MIVYTVSNILRTTTGEYLEYKTMSYNLDRCSHFYGRLTRFCIEIELYDSEAWMASEE
jgi:hypothetical protein